MFQPDKKMRLLYFMCFAIFNLHILFTIHSNLVVWYTNIISVLNTSQRVTSISLTQ